MRKLKGEAVIVIDGHRRVLALQSGGDIKAAIDEAKDDYLYDSGCDTLFAYKITEGYEVAPKPTYTTY